ncbi:MAG: MoaD/ThiS family protein [Anaerolineales bacterium]|jgi:sulfur carrier protein ThiS
MAATLRLSGALKDVVGGRDNFDVESGRSVRETLSGLGIVPDTIALVVVNNEHQSKDYIIQEGDEIRVLAVIGGG